MNPWLIAAIVLWVLGAGSGVMVFLAEGLEDPKHYAIAVFWPLFLVIFLLKGLFRALWTIND